MQWNEQAWTDADGTTCRLSAEHDGRYQLEIGDATLVIGDQQALRDLQKAIELVQNDATSVLTETPPKTIPSASWHRPDPSIFHSRQRSEMPFL